MSLNIKDSIIDFSAPMTGDKIFNLSDYKNETIVLYFYPKDNTPGCTTESLDFKEHFDFFKKHKVHIFGISKDNMVSHQKFKEKHEMPFELISDESLKICEIFDVYKEKSMYGRKYMGIERSTFIIGSDSKLLALWRKVKVKNHIDEVIEFLEKNI